MTDRRDIDKLCLSIYSPKQLNTEPVLHGQAYEGIAKRQFKELTGKKVQSAGLFVDVEYPFLAASPDGLVVGEDAVLEVKCPFTGRQEKIHPGKNFPFLEKVDSQKIQLKHTHAYYYQILGQLHATKRSKCYFVVYTFIDMYIEKIEFNSSDFAAMLPKLQTFYNDHYVPFVSRQL